MRTYFPRVALLVLIFLGASPLQMAAQDQTGRVSDQGQVDRGQEAELGALAARQRAMVEQMQQRYPEIRAGWDRKTGLLTRLEGHLSQPQVGSPQQIVLQYFAANGAMVNMSDASSELR